MTPTSSYQESTDDVFTELSRDPGNLYDKVSDPDLGILAGIPGEEIDESIESVRHLLERVRAVELRRPAPRSGDKRAGRGSSKIGEGLVLNGMQECEARIAMAVDIGSDIPADIRIVGAEGEYAEGEGTETVTENRVIDLSTLERGNHPEMWQTTIPGMGKVTMWFDGGAIVSDQGIAPGNAKGSGWWIRLDDGPVKLVSASIDLKGTNPPGYIRLVNNNDYVRDNGAPKNFAWASTMDFGTTQTSSINADILGAGGPMLIKSFTVEVTVTREVAVKPEPQPIPQEQQETRTETVTENRVIDLSTLERGNHPEMWQTTIPGMGKVTMWFEGGVNVGPNGISSGGSCWWMKFDDGPFKLLLAELYLEGPNATGHLRIQHGGDYIREANGSPKTFPLAPSIHLGGHLVSLLDEGQKGGPGVSLKSLTVEVTVTREVEAKPEAKPEAKEKKELLKDTLSFNFSAFGPGEHTEQDLRSDVDPYVSSVRFVGDGGIRVTPEGGIRALAEGRGRGDWALLFDLGQSVKSVRVTSLDGPGGKIHVIGDKGHQYLEIGTGGVIEVNDTGVREISAATNDKRYVLEEVTLQLSETDMVEKADWVLAETMSPLDRAILKRGLTAEQKGSVSEPTLKRMFGIGMEYEPGAPRLSVSDGGDGFTSIRVTSPYDETFLTTPIGTLHFSHPSGAKDLQVLRRRLSDDFMEWRKEQPSMELGLYADKGLSVPLDRLVYQGDRANGTLSLVIADHRALPEDFFEPKLQVLLAERANVTVAVSSPYPEAVIEIEGGGRFSSEQIKVDGSLDFATATLTIDGNLPSGTYKLRLMDRTSGTILDTVKLRWNAETKQLSPSGEAKDFVPQGAVRDDGKQPIATLLKAAQEQETDQRHIAGSVVHTEKLLAQFGGAIQRNGPNTPEWKALIRAQRLNLLSLGTTVNCDLAVNDDQLWQKFLQHHPGWNRNSFATAKEEQEFMYRRGAEYEPYRKALGSYEDASSRMMEAAMEVVLGARAGRDLSPYLRQLEEIPRDPMYGSTLQQLERVGVRVSGANEFIGTAEGVLHDEKRAYGALLGRIPGDVERLWAKFNGRNYAGNGKASPSSTEVEAAERIEKIRSAQSGLDMHDSNGNVIGRGGVLFTEMAAKENAATHGAAPGVSIASLHGWKTGDGSSLSIEGTTIADIVEINGVVNLGKFSEMDLSNYASEFVPESQKQFHFELTEEAMVNLWAPGVQDRDLTLQISGGTIGQGYASQKGAINNGESISLRLLPGNYTFYVQDSTDYDRILHGDSLRQQSFRAPISMKIEEYNSANIVGKISIEGSEKVMDVSMRVAEFDENGNRKTNYKLEQGKDAVSKLDPSKPVWVIIHGREDQEDSGKMEQLARALSEAGYQVITLDWREAAGSNIPHIAGMQGEAWIETVADWAYRTLKTMKIRGENMRIGGHSWGALGGFEIAERFKAENGFGVDTFIALDPAKDPTLSARYDASQVNIANVSKTSTAFHSSFWGSVGRTHTAQHSVEIRSPRSPMDPREIWDTTLEHGLAVTTVANLFRLRKIDPSNPLASRFAFSSKEASNLPAREGNDAWLWVDSHMMEGIDPSDKYIDAIPAKMTDTNPDDGLPDMYYHSPLRNLYEILSVQRSGSGFGSADVASAGGDSHDDILTGQAGLLIHKADGSLEIIPNEELEHERIV